MPKKLSHDSVTYSRVSYELGDNEFRRYFDIDINPWYISIDAILSVAKKVIAIGSIYSAHKNCLGLPNAFRIEVNGNYNQGSDNTNKLGISNDPQRSSTILNDPQR